MSELKIGILEEMSKEVCAVGWMHVLGSLVRFRVVGA